MQDGSMRRFGGLLAGAIALLMTTAAPAQELAVKIVPVAMHGHPRHAPPDPTPLHVCKVLPRYGGGTCTSPPYAPIGRKCSCEGPHGPRPGVVTWR